MSLTELETRQFMSTSGLALRAGVDLEPPLGVARVVIVACAGISLGGAQIRCVETARALSARGTPSHCAPDCSRETLHNLTKQRLKSVIFIRNLPGNMAALHALRNTSCSLLLDTLDLSSIWHKRSCSDIQFLSCLDGAIANNRVSWGRISADCPRLARKPVYFIEHFHSSTRRVSDGSGWPAAPRRRPSALLVQEHRVHGSVGYCNQVRDALPPGTRFDCFPLWGGFAAPRTREGFFRKSLNMTSATVRTIAKQHFGVGAMFTAVYAKYDLLVQWLPTNSSAQRLTNALASGVPVVARRCPAFEDAYGNNPDVLLAHDHEELRVLTQRLASSINLRRRVSDAGVAAASRFAPDAVITRYLHAMDEAATARVSVARQRGHAKGGARQVDQPAWCGSAFLRK